MLSLRSRLMELAAQNLLCRFLLSGLLQIMLSWGCLRLLGDAGHRQQWVRHSWLRLCRLRCRRVLRFPLRRGRHRCLLLLLLLLQLLQRLLSKLVKGVRLL